MRERFEHILEYSRAVQEVAADDADSQLQGHFNLIKLLPSEFIDNDIFPLTNNFRCGKLTSTSTSAAFNIDKVLFFAVTC